MRTNRIKRPAEAGCVILDDSTLPEQIMLMPVIEKASLSRRLQGMFADGRLSTDKFLVQKHLDKELEL